MIDEPSKHFPDRIEIELHIDADNMAKSTGFSMPLYRDGKSVWRQGIDTAGDIDVAVIEIERDALPETTVYRAFTPRTCTTRATSRGRHPLLMVGFPLGFHDTLHHMPVVRHAVIASSFGLRFQGKGYFLTDARTHRGTSGAPVVMRAKPRNRLHGDLPWMLLGVHSAVRRGHARPEDRRSAGPELRLVRRHPADADRGLRRTARRAGFVSTRVDPVSRCRRARRGCASP